MPELYYEYYAPACARISHVLGEQFVPFLPVVLPPLLHTLGTKVEYDFAEVSEAEEVGAVSHDEHTGMESTVIQLTGQKMRLTMNTTAVIEKTSAARIMYAGGGWFRWCFCI